MRRDLSALAEELHHLLHQEDGEPCCADCAEHPEDPPCCDGAEEARVRGVRGSSITPSKVSRVSRKTARSTPSFR